MSSPKRVMVSIADCDGTTVLRCRGSDRYEVRLVVDTGAKSSVVLLRFHPKDLAPLTKVDVTGGPEIEDE